MVYVLNIHGKPLMPCSPTKARHLLQNGKAKGVIAVSLIYETYMATR